MGTWPHPKPQYGGLLSVSIDFLAYMHVSALGGLYNMSIVDFLAYMPDFDLL